MSVSIEKAKSHLVANQFLIDEDELYEKSDEGDYWARSYYFYDEVKNEHIDDMTPAQRNWLKKIEDKLLEEDY